MITKTRTKPTRRTQAERTASTKQRLMEATVACLIDRGITGTTTTRVCEVAGVSHGSLLHHFGTRSRLLGEALQYVYNEVRGPVVEALEDLPEGPARVDALVELAWGAFGDPRYKAVIELWLAAANDPTLAKDLWPDARAFDDSTFTLAATLFPEIVERNPDFDLYIALLIQTMQGMALAMGTHRSSSGDVMRDRLRRLLGQIIREAFKL